MQIRADGPISFTMLDHRGIADQLLRKFKVDPMNIPRVTPRIEEGKPTVLP